MGTMPSHKTMKRTSQKMRANLRKRKSARTRLTAPKKVSRAKQPTSLQLLGKKQQQCAIWTGKSSIEKLSERLRRFLPERESFWEAALKAGMSRQKYEDRLLEQNKIKSRIGGINRGARLVFSAAVWKKPAIGDGDGTAMARGIQWRMAMAWTGLELLRDSLFPKIHNCEADFATEWCELLNLAMIDEEIRVPGGLIRSATIKNHWQEELAILDFLDIREGKPRKALDAWWVRQTPIADYVTALHAARGIRDVTFHGLLAAHRVAKSGLVSANRNEAAPLDRLVEIMVIVALETLKKLLAP